MRPYRPLDVRSYADSYLSWADYLGNETKLAANRTNAGARPPREGSALCQGIITCGSCGKPMRTNYRSGQKPSYECARRADGLTTPTCRSIAAAAVDTAIAGRLLQALNPAEIALALAAADEVTDRHQRLSRAAELAVERARYEADRAERAFSQVEPENRLVARTLEARWETKLATLAETEQALAAAQHTRPPLPTRPELEKLAADLPGLWQAPTTSNKDRKRLLRTLIADITLLPETDPAKARIGLRWHTGATDELLLNRPLPPGPAKRSPSPAIELVRQLGPTTQTQDLADRLNAAGLTTGHGRPFDIAAVQWIRHAYHIPAPNPYTDGEISVADAARRLGCSVGVIYDWIKTGKLAARRAIGNRLCIQWTEHIATECQRRIIESGHLNPAARRTTPRTRT